MRILRGTAEGLLNDVGGEPCKLGAQGFVVGQLHQGHKVHFVHLDIGGQTVTTSILGTADLHIQLVNWHHTMEVSIVHAAVGRLVDVTLVLHKNCCGVIILQGQGMHSMLLCQDMRTMSTLLIEQWEKERGFRKSLSDVDCEHKAIIGCNPLETSKQLSLTSRLHLAHSTPSVGKSE